MKTFSRIILTIATSFSLINAVYAASPSPKQITALITQADEEKKHGQLEQSVKDYQEVRELVLQVIKEHPNASKPYFALAQINSRLGRNQEAKQAQEKGNQLRQMELKNTAH